MSSYVQKLRAKIDTNKSSSSVKNFRDGVGSATRNNRASSPTNQSNSLKMLKQNWLDNQEKNKKGGTQSKKRKRNSENEKGEPLQKKRRIGSSPKNKSIKKHVTYDPSILPNAEFYKEKQRKSERKRQINIFNKTYISPRSNEVTYHDYPKHGPNVIHHVTNVNLRNQREHEDRKRNGLTFGGRKTKSKRNKSK